MEVILVSNNLFENNLKYNDLKDIELKKITRPLSASGENLALSISLLDIFSGVDSIYSSVASSSLGTAKYLAERYDKRIIVEDDFNDAKIGTLGTKSLKMVKFMQNHDFNIKLTGGESLNEVGNRINRIINKIIDLGDDKIVVFTHRRTILGYLVKYGKSGYNLDDNLIVEYHDKVIYNETEKDVDIVRLTFGNDKKLTNIEIIDI